MPEKQHISALLLITLLAQLPAPAVALTSADSPLMESSLAENTAAPRDEKIEKICGEVAPRASAAQKVQPQSGSPAIPGQKTVAQEQKGSGSFIAAPLPISSAAIGTGVIPVVGYIFPFSRSDHISPPSVVGAAGLFTNNGSRALAAYASLNMREDKYETRTAYVHGNLNYDIYGVGIASTNKSILIPLKQTGQVFFAEFLVRVPWGFHLGPRLWDGSSVVTVRDSADSAKAPPGIGLHSTLTAIGQRLYRDTTPNSDFYPTCGSKVDFTSDFFLPQLGSKYRFQSYSFIFNKYFSLSENQVFAYNLYICGTGGNPPFYGNCIYGKSNELRGYVAGRYLDRAMYATQIEYRLSLPKRFGVAVFGGVGEVFPGTTQIFAARNVLPSIGLGPRFQLSTRYHVNLRGDIAWGKDGHTLGLGIGEAF